MEQKLKEQLDQILSNDFVDGRHTFFQLHHFVLGKEPTIQGKLWQCLRELHARSNDIENIDLEIEQQKDQIDLLSLEAQETMIYQPDTPKQVMLTTFDYKKSIQQKILCRKAEHGKNLLNKLLKKKKMIEEEMQFFANAFTELEKKEKLKSIDDPDAQKEYWHSKLEHEVYLRSITRQPLDIELLKTISCLGLELKIKPVEQIER